MTDTVNALRPIVGVENRSAQEVFDIMSDRVRALAAAPKAEPVNETSVVPCRQCEGEGEYADGLDEAACSTTCTRCKGNGWLVDLTTHPEAPKVEQEPYAWAIEVDGTARGLFYEKTEADFDANIEGGVVKPLHTHPAPASDELLEALEWFCDRVDRGEVRSKSTYARFKALIAKHKGPQS